jgi:hypothetical protein
MEGTENDELQPQDLRDVAILWSNTMQPLESRDWSVQAGDLEWSAQETVDHLAGAILHYATQLASRATERVPAPRSLPAGYSVAGLVGVASILAAVTEATPPEARGWHRAGMADRTGFIAMGCDEMLVHTDDIANGFGTVFQPPQDVCRRVLVRLFPWAPTDVDPWSALLWANGRISLPGHEQLGPDWRWHCKPLDEWDGRASMGV